MKNNLEDNKKSPRKGQGITRRRFLKTAGSVRAAPAGPEAVVEAVSKGYGPLYAPPDRYATPQQADTIIVAGGMRLV
ncbi:MAG: hypothetical protein AB1427_06610 [Thermodesulfobacteriota bacterium]